MAEACVSQGRAIRPHAPHRLATQQPHGGVWQSETKAPGRRGGVRLTWGPSGMGHSQSGAEGHTSGHLKPLKSLHCLWPCCSGGRREAAVVDFLRVWVPTQVESWCFRIRGPTDCLGVGLRTWVSRLFVGPNPVR